MLTLENSLVFSKGTQPDELLQNFWDPEDGFIWSKGKWCEISFAFDAKNKAVPSQLDLIFEFDVFKHPSGQNAQNVMIYLNGLRIGSLCCHKKGTYIFSINGSILKFTENILTIDTPDAYSPADFGSADSRVLGLQLYSLQIRSVD